MKITVNNFNFIPNPNAKNRIIPNNWSHPSKGIKVHGKFLGCFLSILGIDVKLKDRNRMWYVNKESLRSWAESEGAPKGFKLKNLGEIFKTAPVYSKNAKDLFQLLFIDTIDLNVQPLGKQMKTIEEKLKVFNQTHGTALGCLKTAHSDKMDPWQTIKITEPGITEVGKVSSILNELNQMLFEKWGIQSNGGDDGTVIEGKQKNAPQCFQNSKGEIIYPQLLLTLNDFKRVRGVIPDKKSYIQALKDAYK